LKETTPVLTHPTSERLIALGLAGMAKALDEQRRTPAAEALSFEERLGLLVDREGAERDARRLVTRLKFASLRQNACVEDVDLRTPRGLDRAAFAHLADGAWIGRAENPLITGPTGLGKSWIAVRHGPRTDGGHHGGPSATRPAGTATPSSTTACLGSSRRSRSPAATAATPAS
jgi:DNA replication protein DnaC